MRRARLFYHLGWTTRDRLPLITPELERDRCRQIESAPRRKRILVHAVGGTADHVHMTVSIPPTLAVSEAMTAIQGASAQAIDQMGGGWFGWPAEFGATTFAERHLTQVVAYIENQKRHQAEQSLWRTLEDVEAPAPPGPRDGAQPPRGGRGGHRPAGPAGVSSTQRSGEARRREWYQARSGSRATTVDRAREQTDRRGRLGMGAAWAAGERGDPLGRVTSQIVAPAERWESGACAPRRGERPWTV